MQHTLGSSTAHCMQPAARQGPSSRHQPATTSCKHAPRQQVLVHSASGSPPPGQQGPDEDLGELQRKFFSSPSRRSQTPSSALDTVNPYALGRQARKAFDEVWTQLSNLGSPTKSFVFDDTLEPSIRGDAEFEAPQAAYTTVLVVGATGRVGRILIRKLLLRGYKVKALVRKREATSSKQALREEYAGPALPAAVEVVQGDLGDLASCQEAVKGVNKVIFCATARTQLTADLLRVDDRGVTNVVKALQDEFTRAAHRERVQQLAGDDSPEARRARRRLFSSKSKKEIADFSQVYHQIRWNITFVGTPDERQALAAAATAAAMANAGDSQLQRPAVDRWLAVSKAVAEITPEDHLIFEGQLYQRGAYAEVGAPLHPLLPAGEHRTQGTEALSLRVRGDGNQYACVLQTTTGHTYVARFPTRAGFLNIRLPYTFFRPEAQGAPVLDPAQINFIGLRYEAKRTAPATRNARAGMRGAAAQDADSTGKFSLEVDWIKALPSGDEPDVVLVSMTRNALAASLGELESSRVVAAKRRGEEHLRLSGLGYTVIRPGMLVDEPGGYKALVFDQGDRIDQPISAADVADICLRALHEPAARNKTFDVCYEMPSDSGTSMYELVTSAPDKSSSYLTQATAALAKNT